MEFAETFNGWNTHLQSIPRSLTINDDDTADLSLTSNASIEEGQEMTFDG